MRLVRLRIDALPGIRVPFEIDAFEAGVNIVVGPNASGKSRLAHALRCLFDPTASAGRAVHVSARFDDDGTSLDAERIGDRVHWTRDGAPVDPPVLPDPSLLDAWFLHLEDLASVGTSDQEITRRLATELAGGVDLPAARTELVTIGARQFMSERKAYVEARDRRHAAERKVARIARDHDLVDARTTELKDALATADRKPRIEAALEAVDARRRLIEVEETLTSFPAGMEQLYDDALNDAEQRSERVDQAEEDVRRQRDALREHELAARQTGLSDEHPSEPDVRALVALIRTLDGLETKVDDARDRVAAAEGRARTLAPADLEPSSSDPAIPSLSDLDELDLLAQRVDELEREQAAFERRIRADASEGPGSLTTEQLANEAQRAQQEARRLVAWSQAPSGWQRPFSVVRSLAWMVALALVVVGALNRTPDGTSTASGWDAWWLAAAIVAALAFALEVTGQGRPGRRSLRRQIEAMGGSVPSTSDPASVESAVDDAVRRAAAAAQRRDEALALDRLRQDLAPEGRRLETERREASERLTDRMREVGLDPERTGRSSLERARRARIVRDARADLTSERERLAQAETACAEARSEIERVWQRVADPERDIAVEGARPASNSAAAELPRAEDLLERVEVRNEALRRAAHARSAWESAARRASEAREARDQGLAARLGSTADEVAEDPAAAMAKLRERMDARPAWLQATNERNLLDDRIERVRTAEPDDSDIVAWLDAGDRAALEAALSDAQQAETDAEQVRDALSHHKIEAQTAREERELDEARRHERRAQDTLEEAYERALDSEAAAWLLDRVEATYRSERRPATLAAADTWFGRFTHHAFSLQIASQAEDGRLEAIDRASGAVLRPGDLSSGTRAQALLALRLAHATSVEARGPALPFVLDEALTTSDAERFRAVATALAEVAHEDRRQFLYLSARSSDAELWQLVADGSNGRVPRPTVLDLVALRGSGEVWDPSDLAVSPEVRSGPEAPDGVDPADYAARLNVPAVDPWDGGAVHPFHLLRDRLDLVHRLAHFHIDRLGVLEGLLDDPAQLRRLFDTDDAALLGRRARAARAWLRAWKRGRGRPVDRQALIDSSHVSDAFIDRVIEVAEQVDGDGSALIEALENKAVSGFREKARNELETWLIENGYISTIAPASDAELAIACEGPLATADEAADLDGSVLARWLDEGRVTRSVRR